LKGSDCKLLKLTVEKIQHDISGKSNLITLLSPNGEKIFEIDDYDNYVDLVLLKELIEQASKGEKK
jgi:hypothetical protein